MSPKTASLFEREQFRMSRLQVYNWGTFSGLHDIPISERGFLFVGRSGAGKSTLLDAFSALLVPPRWIDFNAAAREADRSGKDRNLVSYIRGAWAEKQDDDSGEITTNYLRPGSTWSALALTYQNSLGKYVVLVQILFIRGNTNSSEDVKRHYLILERAFDLNELENFGQTNFDIHKLKQTLPESWHTKDFPAYKDRFCRMLGIESDRALRLLHKTQSAKNLGDLNTFLREFMLDKPETFDAANRLVDEFEELNAAHQAVVTAREQVQTLSPVRQYEQEKQTLDIKSNELKELQAAIDSYREFREIDFLQKEINSLTVEAEGANGQITQQQSALDNHKSLLRDLERQQRAAGGDQIQQWEAEKSSLEEQRSERLRKREQAHIACKNLGWLLPSSPQAFAEILGNAREEIESWNSNYEKNTDKKLSLLAEKQNTESEFIKVKKEIESLTRQPSNIPANMLELRREISSSLGIAENALPFIGELIEVKSSNTEWSGAIERVLHGFALSLLVDERQYSALAAYIDSTNLKQRLIYYRVKQPEARHLKEIGTNSLVSKLNIKEGPYFAWLKSELQQRFDYSCVDSMQAFKNAERAVTIQGQIKHNHSRHEKDDRKSINDRRNWVLGFDNREKLELFKQSAQQLGDKISKLSEELSAITEHEKSISNRLMHCQTLANIQWQEIDVQPLLDRIDSLERQIRTARTGNKALSELSQQIEEQVSLIEVAETKLSDIKMEHQVLLRKIKDHSDQLHSLQQNTNGVALTPDQTAGLDERFEKHSKELSLVNLQKTTTAVEREITNEIGKITESVNELIRKIETAFDEFKKRWPLSASDLDTSIHSMNGYLAKLTRLETDGLPDYEERFFELLRKQTHQNLVMLSTHLNQARKAILERMELVNDSLQQVPFNQSTTQSTYLRIEVSDKQQSEVKAFKQEIQQALSYGLTEDQEAAEARFHTLRSIVQKLASPEPEHKRWRDMVLDVRQHVEFIGQELDSEGSIIETYRSGAGKSGGQRQKLTTTCLAAALRYQLGGNDYGAPMYAPVVLDEAFDKADNEFTALAMNIFTNFGFQMIVATPLKSVMTLEPFIGGACVVDISDRRHSGVLLIEYDSDRQRLILPAQSGEDLDSEVS